MNEMEQALELRPLDDHLEIDPETGEITGENHELVLDDLPRIARQMRALVAQREMIREYRDAEAERVMNVCTQKIIKLNKQYIFFEAMAEQMLEQSGQKKVEYPALGKFRFRKMPEKVDDSGYEAMSKEEQLSVQNSRKGFFKTKTTITPDKKAIKEQLKAFAQGGSDVDIEGFRVVCPPDKFEFVPER